MVARVAGVRCGQALLTGQLSQAAESYLALRRATIYALAMEDLQFAYSCHLVLHIRYVNSISNNYFLVELRLPSQDLQCLCWNSCLGGMHV